MTIHWKAVEQYFTAVLFVFFNFTQCVILENLSILDLALFQPCRFKASIPANLAKTDTNVLGTVHSLSAIFWSLRILGISQLRERGSLGYGLIQIRGKDSFAIFCQSLV